MSKSCFVCYIQWSDFSLELSCWSRAQVPTSTAVAAGVRSRCNSGGAVFRRTRSPDVFGDVGILLARNRRVRRALMILRHARIGGDCDLTSRLMFPSVLYFQSWLILFCARRLPLLRSKVFKKPSPNTSGKVYSAIQIPHLLTRAMVRSRSYSFSQVDQNRLFPLQRLPLFGLADIQPNIICHRYLADVSN